MSCRWENKHDCQFCVLDCPERQTPPDTEAVINAASAFNTKPYEPDYIDDWLKDTYALVPGACSSVREMMYHIARDVIEKWTDDTKQNTLWHSSDKEQPTVGSRVLVWSPTEEHGEVLTNVVEVYKGRIWAYMDDLIEKVRKPSRDNITPNRAFFMWIYNRLKYVHHENPDVDYMRSLLERIDDLFPEEKKQE